MQLVVSLSVHELCIPYPSAYQQRNTCYPRFPHFFFNIRFIYQEIKYFFLIIFSLVFYLLFTINKPVINLLRYYDIYALFFTQPISRQQRHCLPILKTMRTAIRTILRYRILFRHFKLLQHTVCTGITAILLMEYGKRLVACLCR